MLDQVLINEQSKKFESKISGIFKKYHLKTEKLDNDKTGRRPDYLVTKKTKENFICECKYIASAGMTSDRKYHISTLDPSLHQFGVFQPDTLSKLKEVLYDAQDQFLKLIKDKPEYKEHPFVVVIKSDFFADGFDFLPKKIFGFKNISAVMKLEKDVEQKRELEKYNQDQIIQIIDKKLKIYMPPESVRFKVLLNEYCVNQFKPALFLNNPIIV